MRMTNSKKKVVLKLYILRFVRLVILIKLRSNSFETFHVEPSLPLSIMSSHTRTYQFDSNFPHSHHALVKFFFIFILKQHSIEPQPGTSTFTQTLTSVMYR